MRGQPFELDAAGCYLTVIADGVNKGQLRHPGNQSRPIKNDTKPVGRKVDGVLATIMKLPTDDETDAGSVAAFLRSCLSSEVFFTASSLRRPFGTEVGPPAAESAFG